MNNSIKKLLRESLNDAEIWYHGTPDVRNLEKEGGFTSKTISVQYIKDLEQYDQLMAKLQSSRANGDEDGYWKYLDMVPKLKDNFTFRKPVFLTNDRIVAKTYADPRRSFDYQNSVEKVLQVTVQGGKTVTIVAIGDRFRFIDTNKVKNGFISAGVSETEFDDVLRKVTFHQKIKDGIKTDMVAAIGEWFGFDIIDVVGVLDSYEGGSRQSTVRMVFEPSHIKIIK